MENLHEVLIRYGFHEHTVQVIPFGNGLINNTWKLIKNGKAYILQRINQSVFKHPPDIGYNISIIADYLKTFAPGYHFISPIPATDGYGMAYVQNEGYFRLFPFVEGSRTIDVVETPAQAYEAAAQFGKFTRILKGVEVEKLKLTIPHFHDLSLRHQQFLSALQKGNATRIQEATGTINTLKKYSDIVSVYEQIKQHPDWHLRVTHHDTKISNVLFNEEGRGICVIDLDTIMPGYFISDVGDMMRTYLSPISEEEKDFDKMVIRDEVYKAIVDGYSKEMKGELTGKEKRYFFYAGKFMIYMQALRFLTDHLNDDVYYGARYPGHNLLRAKNQLVLLEKLAAKEHVLGKYGHQ